jgi:hypothetical protein
MLMRVRGRVGALAALCLGVCVPAAHAAAPPQGTQPNSAFARSYVSQHVTSVAATTQRVSCYAPEVLVLTGLAPEQGFPGGGGTACPGATTGEALGPFATQDVKAPPLLVKDHSESDIHVDPTNGRHLIGVSKWFVNAEGYNHLAGFFESFDGGATWPQQGHIPGYEGWTDNSDPAGAFDPWGNFYAVVLPYMFDYSETGEHNFLSAHVNPSLSRMVIGVAVRPRGATSAAAWLTTHGRDLDYVATTPFDGLPTFDKQWIAIDTSRRSKHFGRVYVSWAISGSADEEEGGDASAAFGRHGIAVPDPGQHVYVSYADARPDGTHSDWSTPRIALTPRGGLDDNGSLPHVAPDGTVWMEASGDAGQGAPFSAWLTSSTNGGQTWRPRRLITRHLQSAYDNTTFRSAFGEAFAVGPRKVGKFYPLYLAYENAPRGPVEVFLRASFDGGVHWRKAIRVDDDRGSTEALQPGLAVSPQGTVVVSFYDRRLPCPSAGTAEAAAAGVVFDPRKPFGRANYCINTAVQRYRPELRRIGHNVRMSPHTWDPQLSAARPGCICLGGSFIGDYFGVDARGGYAYTSSVTTYDEGGRNPAFHQQQLVSKLRAP